MSTTTFAALIRNPASAKNQLVEILLGETLHTMPFTLHAIYPAVWQLPYLHDNFTTAAGPENFVKKITGVKLGGAALTNQTAVLSVQNNPNSFFHDVANKQLYVNIGGDPALIPTGVTLVGYFYAYFSSNAGVIFNNNYYQPYIKSVPNINQGTNTVLSGLSRIGAGRVVFVNNTGFFDIPLTRYIWENQKIIIKYGGDSLPYSEYDTAFTGVIDQKLWSRSEVSLNIKSAQIQLLRTLPENVYSSAVNPNIDENAEGRPIPIAYGIFDERTAPEATAINEKLGVNQIQFQLTDHSNLSIDGVWVFYNEESGWVKANVVAAFTQTLDLSATDSYVVDDITNKTITVQFGRGQYVSGSTRVKVAFHGRMLGASLMEKAADIVEDLLTVYNSVEIADLDVTAFLNAKSENTIPVALYISSPERTSDIINKLCVSVMAFFYVDNFGRFVFKRWVPDIQPGILVLDDTDILSMSIEFDTESRFGRTKIGYSQAQTHKNYLYKFANDAETVQIYEATSQKIIQTYLQNSIDAEELRDRYLYLNKTPTATIRLTCKWQLAGFNAGDKIRITTSRAPAGGYSAQAFEIKNIAKNYNKGEIQILADDLKGMGELVGKITADTAPNWQTSTPDEKLLSGYITDDAGLADPADSASKNQSLIW